MSTLLSTPNFMENWLQAKPLQPPAPDTDVAIWGVVYRITLIGVADDHPLYRIVYIGQAIRPKAKTAKEAAEMRWKEEVRHSKYFNRRVGLLWALDEFGESAFHFEIVESRCAPKNVLVEWADEREIALISEHGGVLKDQTRRIPQTLNIRSGGRSQQEGHGAHFAALGATLWGRFMKEMHVYIALPDNKFGCRVPQKYVNPLNGYQLGQRLSSIRLLKVLVTGYPDRLAELRALPMWSDESWRDATWGERLGDANSEWWTKATDEERAVRNQSNKDAQTRPDVLEGHRKDSEAAWKNASDEKREKWVENIGEAQRRPEVAAAKRKRGEKQGAATIATTDAKIALLPPEKRAAAEKAIAKSRRSDAARKAKRLAASMTGSSKSHSIAQDDEYASDV